MAHHDQDDGPVLVHPDQTGYPDALVRPAPPLSASESDEQDPPGQTGAGRGPDSGEDD